MVSVLFNQAEVVGREPVADGTGPSDHIELQEVQSGFVMVALHGVGDLALITAVAEELRSLAPTDHIIVDLSGATIVDLAAIDVLVSALNDASGDAGEFCFLCSRLTGRLLLQRSGAADSVPIFATAGDAQQAQVYYQEGYGEGWRWSAERRQSREETNDLAPDIQSRRARREAAQANALPPDVGRRVGPAPEGQDGAGRLGPSRAPTEEAATG